MTDLELTKLCAEAMGYELHLTDSLPMMVGFSLGIAWNPLHDDAQAMALVKKFGLAVYRYAGQWTAELSANCSDSADLNRAICECVAKLQKERQ